MKSSRRRFLRTTAALSILGSGCLDIPLSSRGDWRQFRYDGGNTGYNPRSDGIRGDVVEKWVYETSDGVVTNPAVVDGTVYVGDFDGKVYAIDAVTGEEEWVYDAGRLIKGSSPAVFNDTVYIGSWNDEEPKGGYLQAINAKTGERRWRLGAGSSASTSPKVVGNSVFFTGNDDVLYKLNLDGEKKWRFSEGFPEQTPAVKNGVVYIGGDVRFFALDANTKETKWQIKPTTESDVSTGTNYARIASPPALDETTVYFSTGDYISSVERESGQEKWRFNETVTSACPAIIKDTLYVTTFEGILYSIDAETGEGNWVQRTESGTESGSPIVTDETVYFQTSDYIYGFDHTGEKLWEYQLGEGVGTIHSSSPAIVDETLYTGHTGNQVVAITERS